MELIHVRLKDELGRLGLKPAAAAKIAGEEDSQGLRDVLGGRKRLSADLLAALAVSGVDVAYVLTGNREGQSPVLTAEEQVLIDGFRALDAPTRKRMMAFLYSGEAPRQGQQMNSVSVGGSVGGSVAGGDLVIKSRKKAE